MSKFNRLLVISVISLFLILSIFSFASASSGKCDTIFCVISDFFSNLFSGKLTGGALAPIGIQQTETNVALGKLYTFSAPPHGAYPDDGGQLTDGLRGADVGQVYQGTEASVGWIGETNVEVTVDLGASYDINTAKVYAGGGGEGGITFPHTIQVFVSADGSSWSSAGELAGISDVEQWAEISVSGSARYVKLAFANLGGGAWTMLGEIEVYGVEESQCPDGMISYWKGEGNAADSKDANDGAWTGTELYTAGHDGQGQSFSFNGNSYIYVPSIAFSSGEGTVEAWGYYLSGAPQDLQIVSQGGPYNSFNVAAGPSYSTHGFYINGEYRLFGPTYGIPANTWTHVALTWDQTSGTKVYVNGIFKGSNPSIPPVTTRNGLWIGSAQGQTHSTGYLDDVAIYNSALDAQTIAAHAAGGSYCAAAQEVQCGAQGTEVSNIVNYWKLDETSGTVADDYVDGNDGTLNNGPVWTTNSVADGALQFDGNDDYMRLNNINTLAGSSEMTFMYWVKYNGFSGCDLSGYIADDSTQSLRLGNCGGTAICIDVGARTVWSCKDYAFNTGQWYLLTLTTKNGAWKTYLNDALVDSGASGALTTYNPISYFGLGASIEFGGATHYINGIVDEAAFFNKELSLSEIQKLYQRGSAGNAYCPYGGAAAEICDNTIDDDGDTLIDCLDSDCSADPACQQTGCPSSLVSYWKGDGDATDSKGNNDGAIVGGVTYSAGKSGQAFSLPGNSQSSNYISVPHDASLNVNHFTVEAWIKPNDISTGSDVIEKSGNEMGTMAFDLRTGEWDFGAGGVYGFVNQGASAVNNAGGPMLNQGQWNHIAETYDGSNVKIYVNGHEFIGSSYSDTLATNTYPLFIGRNFGTGEYDFNGLIDEVALYNEALDAQTIAAHAAGGSYCEAVPEPECPSGMISYWKGENNADDYLGAHDGVNQGAGFAAGKIGQAFDLSGESDYVEIADSAVFSPANNPVSMEFWIKTTQANFAAVIGKGGGSEGFEYSFDITRTNPGALSYYTWDLPGMNNGVSLDGTNAVNDGQWHHVVLAYDNSARIAKLYVDGALDTQNAIDYGGMMGDGTAPLTIGKTWNPNLNGMIDEVAFYDKILTESEIEYHYNEGLGRDYCEAAQEIQCGDAGDATEGIISYWKADGDTSDAMNLNPGTLNGATFASGKAGSNAFLFDGIDDNVQIPYSSSLHLWEPVTVMAWVYKTHTTENMGIFSTTITPPPEWGGWMFNIRNSPPYTLNYLVPLAEGYVASPNEIPNNEWVHVAFTREGNAVKLYVNGNLDYADNNYDYGDGNIGTNNPAFIGSDYYSGAESFPGKIDEIAVYGRALSADEIKEHYDRTSSGQNHYCPYGGAAEVCGNSVVETGEECDDGNLINGDGCSSACLIEQVACGDGDTQGMISYWKADGDAQDSANGNHGTLIGDANANSAGKVGNAFSLDGDGDYVNINGLANLESFTFEVWIKTSSVMNYGEIMSTRNGCNQCGQIVRMETSGDICTYVHDGDESWYYVCSSGTNYEDNNWHHVAVTNDKINLKLYIDNAFIGSTPSPVATPDANNLMIGRDFDGQGDYYFNGMIDEVAVYDEALTADEINNHFMRSSDNKAYCPYGGPSGPVCGDGNVDAGEECDDGNTENGDGCSSICLIELPACGTQDTNGMISYWKADGDAADYKDSNHGTLMNGATFSAGKVGQAFDTSVSGSYIDIQDNGFPAGNSARSISMWVYHAAPEIAYLFDYGTAEENNWFDLLVYDTGQIRNGWYVYDWQTDYYMPVGQWVFLTITYDGTTAKLYADGNLVDSDNTRAAASTILGDYHYIGGSAGWPDGSLNGMIDEVAIYSEALTPEEVQKQYERSSSGKHYCVAGPVCGDGTVDEGEECDDGNTQSGDGCSATCRLEDADKDSVPDYNDNCRDIYNPRQEDSEAVVLTGTTTGWISSHGVYLMSTEIGDYYNSGGSLDYTYSWKWTSGTYTGQTFAISWCGTGYGGGCALQNFPDPTEDISGWTYEIHAPGQTSDGIGDACDNCRYVVNADQLDINQNCPSPPYQNDPQCGDACEVACTDGINLYAESSSNPDLIRCSGGTCDVLTDINFCAVPYVGIAMNEDNIILDCHGYTLTNSYQTGDGIWPLGSNDVIENCVIDGFVNGISLAQGGNAATIQNNTISNTSPYGGNGIIVGVPWMPSNDNIVKENTLTNCYTGISIEGGANNIITLNTISSSTQRDISVSSGENKIYYNNLLSDNLINQIEKAVDISGNNLWDDGKCAGNYYSGSIHPWGWNCNDDGNGFCDEPRLIQGVQIYDNHPLVNAWPNNYDSNANGIADCAEAAGCPSCTDGTPVGYCSLQHKYCSAEGASSAFDCAKCGCNVNYACVNNECVPSVQAPDCVIGDVNGDGVLNIQDVISLEDLFVGNPIVQGTKCTWTAFWSQ